MVSVIVPVYNIEKYISICVESLLMQTYSEIEIILVDDGSTDSSGQICDEFAMRDSRIMKDRLRQEVQAWNSQQEATSPVWMEMIGWRKMQF